MCIHLSVYFLNECLLRTCATLLSLNLGEGDIRVHKISSFTADLKENGVKMKGYISGDTLDWADSDTQRAFKVNLTCIPPRKAIKSGHSECVA